MKITNSLGLPEPFMDAVTREYTYTDKRYSATSILGGVREAILKRRYHDEITDDVANMIWLIFGTAVHSVLENAQETETQLKENKLEMTMENGYTLSGIFDLYDDATGTVTDYKTASVWKVVSGDWEDYRKQCLIYVVLLRSLGFDAWRGEIVALLKDHSKTKAKIDKSYPQYPVHKVSWLFTNDEIADMERWLNERFREIERCESLPDHELPLCADSERWHKPDTWAVIKTGNKRATKVHGDEESAQIHADNLTESTGKPHHVEYRRGEDMKCLEYCSVREFCTHGKALRNG